MRLEIKQRYFYNVCLMSMNGYYLFRLLKEIPEYMRTCNPEWFSCYEYNCKVMLNTMHKDLFNEKSLGWFREHLEAFAPYSEGARKLLKVIEEW